MKKKKTPVTETPVEKSKDLFDFLTGIYTDQTSDFYDSLSDDEKKKYRNSRYMLHRFLSMNVHYSQVVNELQKWSTIPDRAHYLFLANMIPRGKQFYKYVKGSKDEKYEKWLVELVAKHYNVSKVEAIQYIEIYMKQNKAELREICRMYGTDPQMMKKAKL